MELLYKPNLSETLTRWQAYWQGEILDRPIVLVSAPKDPKNPPKGPPYMDGVRGDHLDAIKRYDDYAKNTYFGGDLVPHIPLSFGPDQFALFIGGEQEIAKDGGTAWIHPFVTDWKDVDFSLDMSPNGTYSGMLTLNRLVKEMGAGKYIASVLDLHSNMDCLVSMRGPQELCYDIYDCPEQVMDASKKARALYKPIYDSLLSAGGMDQTGSIGWIPLYCEGRFAVTQCDFMGLIGRDILHKYVLPGLEDELSTLDHSIYHYDGPDALRHLDDILAVKKLDAIQWVSGDGQPKMYTWMPLLQKIQAAGKGLYLYDMTLDEVKVHYKELRPERAVYQMSANSPDEADAIVEWFVKNT